MNGKSGNPEDGPIDLDKLGYESAVLLRDDHSASNGEVTIKPRMPDSASIGLYANLEIALGRTLGDGSNLDKLVSAVLARDFIDTHLEVRAIDVSGDNAETSSMFPFLRKSECNQGRLVPGHPM